MKSYYRNLTKKTNKPKKVDKLFLEKLCRVWTQFAKTLNLHAMWQYIPMVSATYIYLPEDPNFQNKMAVLAKNTISMPQNYQF